MKLYTNTATDPFFNLAAEEYFLKNADDDIILLWRNAPSVIIGKNQNAFAEINFDFVRENGIKVVRRMTGGGAVFHDLGNLNYTFISPKSGSLSDGMRAEGLDFAYFTAPIINALRGLSLDASLSGRNDIVVNTSDGERKISGNAQCVLNGVTLHHGTLLFSAELSKLSGALNVDPGKLVSKGIASVRSRVANIRDILPEEYADRLPDTEMFTDYISKKLSSDFQTEILSFNQLQADAITKLAEDKYSSDEWNFRRFGNFSTKCEKRFAFGNVEIQFSVKEGKISEISVLGDFFGEDDVSELCEALVGIDYSRDSITSILKNCHIEKYIFGAEASEIANLLLSVTSVL